MTNASTEPAATDTASDSTSEDRRATPPPRLLMIDDIRRTVLDIIAQLRYDGCVVEPVESEVVAAEFLRTTPYSMLVVDQRLPGDEVRGGTNLVRALRKGVHGDLNQTVPFVLLTASEDEEDRRDAESISGCLDVIRKAGDVIRRVRTALAAADETFVPRDLREQASEERLYVTLRCESRAAEQGRWEFAIDEWMGSDGDPLWISEIELPDGVTEQLRAIEKPVFVEASVNLAATKARQLRPRDFRLVFKK